MPSTSLADHSAWRIHFNNSLTNLASLKSLDLGQTALTSRWVTAEWGVVPLWTLTSRLRPQHSKCRRSRAQRHHSSVSRVPAGRQSRLAQIQGLQRRKVGERINQSGLPGSVASEIFFRPFWVSRTFEGVLTGLARGQQSDAAVQTRVSIQTGVDRRKSKNSRSAGAQELLPLVYAHAIAAEKEALQRRSRMPHAVMLAAGV